MSASTCAARPLPFLATAALLGTLVLTAGCGSGSPSASAGPPASVASHTRVVDVSPVTGAGVMAGGFRSAATITGASCIPGSEAIGRAYRCFAGNEVYDPCWPLRATTGRASTTTVLCLLAPWSRTAARLTVRSQPGPVPALGPVTEPWGVQLQDGTRCVLVQGAHVPFDGTPVDYYCGPDLGLLHGVAKGGRIWSARSVRISKSGHMSPGSDEKIAIAWFGRPVGYR
jgi:hypothetical protein